MQYKDRNAAAKVLQHYLSQWANDTNTVVCVLPRGGVEIGVELALGLNLPLFLLHIKKIVHPYYSEVAIGAVSDTVTTINPEWGGNPQVLNQVLNAREIIARRKEKYIWRNPSVRNKTILLVDDGVATGITMETAIKILRKQNPKDIVLAVPVASKAAFQRLSRMVERCICPYVPGYFNAVGSFYKNFEQVNDAAVVSILQRVNKKSPAEPGLK